MKQLLSEERMSKFTFTQTYDDTVTTKEFETDYLYEVIERFEEFLRGCGFYFNGTIDVVEDETEENMVDKTITVSFNSPSIFESPDGGQTVYSREFGSSEKTMHEKK